MAVQVLVLGDVSIDRRVVRIVQPLPDQAQPRWRQQENVKHYDILGGAWFVAQCIRAAGFTNGEVKTWELPDEAVRAKLVYSWAELERFPVKPDDKKNKVYRIQTLRGFHGPNREDKPVPMPVKPAKDVKNVKDQILVIEDQANGYRDDEAQQKAFLTEALEASKWVVYKATRSLPKPDSWFWQALQEQAKKVIAVISADSLRELGVMVGRGLSWEKVIEGLVGTKQHEVVQQLLTFEYVIVRLCLSGAMLGAKGGKSCHLVFDPPQVEGSYSDDAVLGTLTGYNSVLAAAVLRELAGAKGNEREQILSGMATGIAACRKYLELGLGRDAELAEHEKGTLPGATLFDKLSHDLGQVELECPPTVASLFEKSFHPKLPPDFPEQVVQIGLVKALANCPKDKRFPIGQLSKKFLIVDRQELEGFRAIGNLVRNYAAQPNPPKPLSIAVFGAPGTGKSFGIKEISKSILGSEGVKFIECNLAQFTRTEDLDDIFIAVRDVTTDPTKLPVVFFDEFDADLAGPLGWIKSFLAPMQDGKFKYKQSTFAIGKSIFVFAGGTRHRYEDLYPNADTCEELKLRCPGWTRKSKDGDPNLHLEGDEQAQYAKHILDSYDLLPAAKVKDFVSRLRGHVNIADINPPPDTTANSGSRPRSKLDTISSPPTLAPLHIVRRAVLLRSSLEKLAPNLFDEPEGSLRIEPEVLRAFLQVSRYKHGVRSMEAIIEMSALARQPVFRKWMLPKVELMEMHVEGNEFLGKVAEGGQ